MAKVDSELVVDLDTLRSAADLKVHRTKVRARIKAINDANEGKALPEAERGEFATLVDHDTAVSTRIDEFEKRQKIVTDIAADEKNVERTSPTVIIKGGSEVWELRELSDNFEDPAKGNANLRDRALKAVEATTFPDQVDREAARGHIRSLLERHYDDSNPFSGGNEIARRIVTTGSPTYRSAFAKTLRAMLKGQPVVDLTPDEMRAMSVARAMSVGTGSAGGFAVPYSLDPTVIPTSNLSVNPFRAICRVEPLAGSNEWRGVTSGAITAGYGTEAAEASDNAPTLAQPTLTTVRAFAFVPVSIELTQDWGSLQSELAQLIQDGKDDLEATKFTTGTGTNEPQGLITGATNTVTAGGSGAFAVADVYALEQALAPRFRPRAKFIANRFTYNKVRQFDTGGGASMWQGYPNPLQNGLANGAPRNADIGSSLIGYGAYEDSAMAAALTTGSKILVIGDPRYYLIVDRVGMDIEVIPHLFGSGNRFPTGQRGFYAFWRNMAKVLSASAFQVLVTG